MRPGFNPNRRNRNIGTGKQGHGQNNVLCVASPVYASGPFWEQLGKYQVVRRQCGGRELPFFVEETRETCLHACSVGDIVFVLGQIPAQDYAGLAAIVLRQPKRKEEILHAVWGRMAYWSNVGRPQQGSTAGRVVILEALQPDRIWYRHKSLGPVAADEMERLAGDGHKVTSVHSRIKVESSLQATRATQLYRTLPHEIGHLVDYATKVPEYDESKGISLDRHLELADGYWQRPSQEREVFAHRYADAFRSKMFSLGLFPFPRIESWIEDGLRSCDFVA